MADEGTTAPDEHADADDTARVDLMYDIMRDERDARIANRRALDGKAGVVLALLIGWCGGTIAAAYQLATTDAKPSPSALLVVAVVVGTAFGMKRGLRAMFVGPLDWVPFTSFAQAYLARQGNDAKKLMEKAVQEYTEHYAARADSGMRSKTDDVVSATSWLVFCLPPGFGLLVGWAGWLLPATAIVIGAWLATNVKDQTERRIDDARREAETGSPDAADHEPAPGDD